jgi:NAD(P)-dependent dehydrogenase (short-subunit alcohol dehydrogenase family)
MSRLAPYAAAMDIRDRVAPVTGGGGPGTGRAIATRLAADGAAVVVADIDEEGGRETVRRVESAGGRAALVHADVTTEPDIRAMVAFAEETFGGLDVLVNSAGGTEAPFFPDAPAAHWGRTLDLNLRGPMLSIQHALPAMERRGGGAVVNIASVAGLGTLPNGLCEYSVAKAGLIRLTVVLAPMAERRGVRVNCVVPDWIGTEATAAYVATLAPAERAHVPPRLTPPQEIAGAVAHFVRHDSLAGRVLVCWCDHPWALVAERDLGYRGAEVMPALATAPTDPRSAAG